MRSKKLLICLVFLFVSLFAFGFNAKVNAIETSDAITVIGAQVRSTGNAGIRFVANETYEGEDSYGIILAFGETEANEEFVIGGTVNGKAVANAEVATAEDGVFKVTLYNIPEVYYSQAISARAYVKVGENYVYSSTVCVKSLAEVALKGKANGEEGTLIDDVAEYVSENYKYVIEETNGVTVMNALDLELAKVEADFIADANALLGLSLTVNTTYTAFVAALAPDKSVKTDVTAVNAYKFFSDVEMAAKWGWIAEYLKVNGSTHVKNQAYEILDDGIYNSRLVDGLTLSNLYGLEHFASAVYVLLNAEKQSYTPNQYSLSMDFTDSSKYEVVNQYYSTSAYYKAEVAERLASLTKVGATITLPAALEKVGYTWAGWTDGTNTYAAESEYVINANAELEPSYTVNEYTIKYYNDAEEYTELAASYTIEQSVILPTPEGATGYMFAGWYDNAELEGEAITTIEVGTTGEKTYYAKWVFGFDTVVVDDDYASLEEGTKVTVNEVEYTVGADAQATLAAGVEVAKEGATVYVAAGTYAEDATISANNVTILGPNANVTANGTAERAEEAVVSGVVTLGKNSAGVTINGLKFVDDAQVTSATTSTEGYYVSNFTFTNNYFDKGTSTTRAISFECGDLYTANLTIDNCYFTANSIASSEVMIKIYNNDNLTLVNSKIENVSGIAFGIYDSTNAAGLRQNLTVENNTFKTIVGSALWINYTNFSTNSTYSVSIKKNLFEDIDGGACIDFEKNGARYTPASFEISLNTFKDVYKCVWTVLQNTNFTNNKVYIYEGTKTSGYIFKAGNGGSSRYGSGTCGGNLFLSADGATVYTTDVSSSLFNTRVTGYAENNYASVEAYEEAIAALEN